MNTTSSIMANSEYSTMSIDDMRKIAPRIFFTEPTNPELSKHYTFASTEAVVNDMARLGWDVVNAAQPHPRRMNSVNSYHMVTFRKNTKIVRTMADGTEDVYYPQIILTNSHDGFTCFQFRVSLYRVNTGMNIVLGNNDTNKICIRHIGYSFEELRDLTNKIVEDVPTQIAIMNSMKDRVLDITEKRALALAAFRSRKGDKTLEMPDVILDELLEVDDPNNVGDDIWSVFNNLMEKMLEGSFRTPTKKGFRKARKIKSIAKTINFSHDLFQIAASFIR